MTRGSPRSGGVGARRWRRWRVPAFLALLVALLLGVTTAARADLADEQALAARYAPVVRLVEQEVPCGPGEPYRPLNVNLLFGDSTVALRGPWNAADLVEIGPSAEDLVGLYEYHLDFPGNALDPRCSYERWSRRLTKGHRPAVYAHVVADPGHPGELALQYWLFYAYNDWNNLHEGDWEMIQLLFDADNAEQALSRSPTKVGYSQHEGAEQADWGDEKLEIVDGTHPVVHPAAGSHANFFGEGLHLGRSASQGVGCDDTRGPTFDLRPIVFTIPSDPDAARDAFPWTAYEGRWGELQKAFYNGPTGPNLKTQWTQPVFWSEEWRDQSYSVPAGGAFGSAATDFFCGAVGGGSRALVRLANQPLAFGLTLSLLALLVVYGIARATWTPVRPLHLPHRRSWGQILSAAGRMYVQRLGLFVGIGILLIPIELLVGLIQTAGLDATSVLGVQGGGESSGLVGFLVLALGIALTLLGVGLVQMVTTRALVEIDAGRPIGALRAYRLAARRLRPLAGALSVAVVVVSLLTSSVFLIPVAVWFAGTWSLIAPVIELEGTSGLGALRRSNRLVRRRWLKVSSLIILGGAIALVAGPLLGSLLILFTDAPFWLVNVVAGVIYAVTIPLVAITTVYVYFDVRVQDELLVKRHPDELPAEIQLSL
jgi:hypothetical protein